MSRVKIQSMKMVLHFLKDIDLVGLKFYRKNNLTNTQLKRTKKILLYMKCTKILGMPGHSMPNQPVAVALTSHISFLIFFQHSMI